MTKHKFRLRSNLLYTIYRSMALDLLFFSTYYAKFFKDVKHLTNAEVSAVTMVSCVVFVVLEPLFVKIIAKIGNTKSIRAGNIIWFIALTLMAFSQSKIGVYIGYTVYQTAFLLKVVEPIILRNNLILEGVEEEFSYIEGRTYFIYSVITSIILLVTGILYEKNPYLIVYAGYLTTLMTTILAFLIKDETEYVPEVNTASEEKQTNKTNNKNIFKSWFIILIFICSCQYIGVICQIFSSSSLLLADENIGDKAITLYIFIGRISRMISSYIYAKEYRKLKNKMAIIYPALLLICLICSLLTGLFIKEQSVRIALFVILIVVIYMLRDPYTLYIQDTIFNYVDAENRRAVLSANSLFQKIGNIISCLLSIMVLNFFDQKQYIAFGFYGIQIFITLIFSILLYRKIFEINKSKESKEKITE